MSRSLYSLDREEARRLLTKNGLAKPMAGAPVLSDDDEPGQDFARIKQEASAGPGNSGGSGEHSGFRERALLAEEKLASALAKQAELEGVLERYLAEGSRLDSLKERNSELEGGNRLLADQLEALNRKFEVRVQEEANPAVVEVRLVREELEKVKAETVLLRDQLAKKESEMGTLKESQTRLTAVEAEKAELEAGQDLLRKEKEALSVQIRELEILLDKAGSEAALLKEELEKARLSAGSDLEQNNKLRKQVETARELLTKAAEENGRLEKERKAFCDKAGVLEKEKAEQLQLRHADEVEKGLLNSKIADLSHKLAKVTEENIQLREDLEKTQTASVRGMNQIGVIQKELDETKDALSREKEKGQRFEKESAENMARVQAFESEKKEWLSGKEKAEEELAGLAGKVASLDQELEEIKSRPGSHVDREEMTRLADEARISSDLLKKSQAESLRLVQEVQELKEKLLAAETESGKAKEALKQAVMAYHQAVSEKGK